MMSSPRCFNVTVIGVALVFFVTLHSAAAQSGGPGAAPSGGETTLERALMRVAQFLPSVADLADPSNEDQPAGPLPETSGRVITLGALHTQPFASGIAARVVDGNGNLVPFARAKLRLFNRTALHDTMPLPQGRTAANDPAMGGALNVDWLTGATDSAGPDGLLNFTNFRVMWCGSAETRFVLRVCPLASTEADAAKSDLICSENITFVLRPDPNIVRLRFADDHAGSPRSSAGPTAVAGALFDPFRVELCSSCDTPLTLDEAPATPAPTATAASVPTSARNTTTTTLVPNARPTTTPPGPTPMTTIDPLEVGRVEITGIGLAGILTQPVLNNDTGAAAAATFELARAVILPGAEAVSYLQVAPPSTVAINATFVGSAWATPRGATVARLSATTELVATIIPAATSSVPSLNGPPVAVAAQLIRLEGDVRTGVEDMLRAWDAAEQLQRAAPSSMQMMGAAAADMARIPVTSMPGLAPGEITKKAGSEFALEMNVIRKYEGAVFAFVFNASVFASRDSLRSVELGEGQLAAANNTLFCGAEFDMDNAPRGLLYGLTQSSSFIFPMQRFAIRSYDPATRRTSQQFAVPFQVGPYRPLSSTLTETLTCNLNPGLLGLGYQMRAPLFRLEVFGLEDKEIGTARRILSIFAILNPEIAYMSVLIQVCDCTIDHGLPLDMAIHPLQFPIGTNQLTRYFFGALVGNTIVVLLASGLSFGAAWLLRRRAEDVLVRADAASKKGPQQASANHRAKLQKKVLLERANRIFPHVPLMVLVALYPGTTYAAYGLLPRLSNTFILMLWCIVGVIFAIVVPCLVVRVAVKLSPEFRPLDVHAITKGWLWKVLIPLGDYDGDHADMTRWRFTFENFRGDYRWFYAPLMGSWFVMSMFGANFAACSSRFLLPLVVQVAFFFTIVARAPFITAYQNVVAVAHALMIIVGLAFLFWDGQERRSNTFLSSWSIALVGLSIAMTATKFFYGYYNEKYVIGASRGHLDEDFLYIEDEDAKQRRERTRYDPSGKVRVAGGGGGDGSSGAAAGNDEDDDEFVDAAKEAAEGEAYSVKVVDIHKRANPSAFALFDEEGEQGSGANGAMTRKDLIRRRGHDPLGDLLDDILDGPTRQYAPADAVSQREFETKTMLEHERDKRRKHGEHTRDPATGRQGMSYDEFEEWVETMTKREKAEADRAALIQLRTSREHRYVADHPLAKNFSEEERRKMMMTHDELQRLKDDEEERRIDAYFARRSRPTAGPTYEYGRRFAPGKQFGYEKRLEQLTGSRRLRGGDTNPEDADDGLDGEDATFFEGATDESIRNEKLRIRATLRTPAMPPRKLSPAMEAVRQKAIERAEAQAARRAKETPVAVGPGRRSHKIRPNEVQSL